jgi:nitrite reductase/ring-hydroxylating ferredoxin subunit
VAAFPENVGIGQVIAKGMPWLDGVASVMEGVYAPVLGADAPRQPRDFLYGTWLGHPLHAAVVAVPLGSWSAMVLFDLLNEERTADQLLGVGLVGAAGAAVTGAAQWQDTTNDEDPRRLGSLHAILNFASTGLMAGSWLLRRQGQRGAGVALSTLGVGLGVASAWLGGELAYGLGIGVDHTAFQKKPTKWTDVAALDELQDGVPTRVEVKGTPVLLLRQGDRLRAIAATCPHLGGPLDKGEIEGTTVTCPWHASVFSLVDGALVHGPATVPVTAYEARIEDGRVSIRVNASQPGAVLSSGEQKSGTPTAPGP